MKMYKLFREVNGKLYPLYIDAKNEVVMGEWLMAKELPKTKDGRIKARGLNTLSYRPGWHTTEFPIADHIGTRQPNGKLYQAKGTIWCEIEIDDVDGIDYTEELAKSNKARIKRCMKTLPHNGYYWFTTNASAEVRWMISEKIKVVRRLTYEEVVEICEAHNIEPQPLAE